MPPKPDFANQISDEFEVSEVIAFIFADHEKLVLIGRTPMQPVTAVKHEDLKRNDVEFIDEIFNFLDVLPVHGCQVVGIVHLKTSFGQFQHLGKEAAVRPALVQIIRTGSHIVQTGGHSAHTGSPALSHRIFFER